MKRMIPFLLFAVLMIDSVYANCLNETELKLVYNKTNSSELISILDLLCERDENLESNLIDNVTSLESEISDNREYTEDVNASLLTLISQENETCYSLYENLSVTIGQLDNNTYNKSEVDSFIGNCYNSSEGERLETLINDNLTQFVTAETLDEFEEDFVAQVDTKKIELTDIFDEKYRDMKDSFLSMEEYQNYSTTLRNEIYMMVQGQLNFLDRYIWYIFLIVVLAMGCVVAIVKFKPHILRKPIIKDFKAERRDITELTSKSELKKKIDMIRNLKLKVVQNKELNRNQKITLLQKIDKNEIWDDDSLKKETELLVRISKVKK